MFFQGSTEQLEQSVDEYSEKRLPNIFEIILNLPPGIRREPTLYTQRFGEYFKVYNCSLAAILHKLFIFFVFKDFLVFSEPD